MYTSSHIFQSSQKTFSSMKFETCLIDRGIVNGLLDKLERQWSVPFHDVLFCDKNMVIRKLIIQTVEMTVVYCSIIKKKT